MNTLFEKKEKYEYTMVLKDEIICIYIFTPDIHYGKEATAGETRKTTEPNKHSQKKHTSNHNKRKTASTHNRSSQVRCVKKI